MNGETAAVHGEAAPVNAAPLSAADAARELAEEFERRRLARLREKKRISPVHSNRASSLDDPCERRLYLYRTAWDHQAPPSDTLQSIFDEGNLHEGAVVRLMDELGMRLRREQAAGEWKAVQITGHIEGEIEWRGVRLLAEIKSISGNMFDRAKTAEDLRDARGGASYLRRWFGQVQIYMLLASYEAAVMFIKSKQTGEVRAIPVALDYEYAEGLLQRAERINVAVAAGEPPPFVLDADECRRCSFFGRACDPPTLSGAGAAVVVDEHLLEAAQTWQETAEAARKHDEADEELRGALRGTPLAIVGGLTVETKTTQTTKYEVPPAVKAQYATKVPQERVYIRPTVKP